MVRGLFLEFELAGRGPEQRDHRFLCDTLVDDTRHFGGAWLVAPEHAGKNTGYEPVDLTDDRAAHHFRGRDVLLSSRIGLQGTHFGVILAHAALGTPFVVITVTATLVGFDNSLIRASASLGASPTTTFYKVIVPLILPGVISGALFAFITSFDEVIVVLFVGSFKQRTIPWQMFSGIREHISPTILAVATILVVVSVGLLVAVELLRRRGERLRGIQET